MWASYSGLLSPEALADYLNGFYQKAADWDYLVAGAFPGFHDIYKEAGVGDGYGYLDAREGDTFAFTLQTALDSDPDVVQLITWNDFGEGTIIEPTAEFAYRYLEMLQEAQRSHINPDFAFTADDLTLPLHIFKLRKLYADDVGINGRLDQATYAILINNLSQAKAILAEYPLDE
jgi:hypothetical protein